MGKANQAQVIKRYNMTYEYDSGIEPVLSERGWWVDYDDVEPLITTLNEAYNILKDATTTHESFWLEEMHGTIEDLLERIDQLRTNNTKEPND